MTTTQATISDAQLDELFAWLKKRDPQFPVDSPFTRDVWREALDGIGPEGVRRAANAINAVRPAEITPTAFVIAARGGEERLRKHLENNWKPGHRPEPKERQSGAR